MLTQNKRLIIIPLIVVLLLLVPLVAMQFTNNVNWSSFDFMVAGILLFGSGMLCELVIRKVRNTRHRVILCGVLLVLLFLVWAELAIGIFGTPIAGN